MSRAIDGPAGDVGEVDRELAAAAAVERAAASSSRWIMYSGLSARSTRMSRRGPKRVDLAGELGADRPAGAGDHHDLVADQLVDARGVVGHLLAGQEVREPDLAEPVGVELPSSSSWIGGTVRTSRPASSAALHDLADGRTRARSAS